jgi:hypothetical protein
LSLAAFDFAKLFQREEGEPLGGDAVDTGGASQTGGISSVSIGSASGSASTGGSVAVGGANGEGGTSAGGQVSSGGSLPNIGGSPMTGGAADTGGDSAGDAALGGASTGGASIGGTSTGGAATGGASTGGTSTGDTGGGGGSAGEGSETPAVVTYPDLPGAERSSLYSVTVDGIPLFVEKLTKFSPEMQVHYAHCSLSSTATVEVTVNEDFNSYKLSPTSRNISATKNGRTITFSTGPNYLILHVDSKELLFILLDPPESNPPRLGDASVKNIADSEVDNTGATLVTSHIQAAIDAASGSSQNILYFPPENHKIGELWLKRNMTMYLAGGAILYGSNSTGDFDTGSGGINIEGCPHGVIRMYQISNTKILGREVIDGNGKSIRAQNDTNINLLKIVRDPSFWNTLIYRSDLVTIQNYKMINCRPTTTTYNNTDGVHFENLTIQGHKITTTSDLNARFSVNSYVSRITFE